MARSRRSSRQLTLQIALGVVALAATLACAALAAVQAEHNDEMHRPLGTQVLQERVHELFARQLVTGQGGDGSGATSATEKRPEGQDVVERKPLEGPELDAVRKKVQAQVEKHRKEKAAAEAAAAAAAVSAAAEPAAAGTAVAELGLESADGEAEDEVERLANGHTVKWKLHEGKSCQNYANGDSKERSLEDSKAACLANEACMAIECPRGEDLSCTIRAVANLIPYEQSDCYEQIEFNEEGKPMSAKVHPAYNSLLHEYPFQQVTTQSGNQVNIILVRSQMNSHQQQLFRQYKDDILFLGISSMNDYPLNEKVDYVGMFPGFLHMMREPEKHFPPHVKTILMSQSDFSLPSYPERDYSVPRKYDFTYSASDCDVLSDGHGWCGWSKNWTFVKEALVVMCGEFNMTGVLVATKDKSGRHAYSIPKSCKGKMIQTTFLAKQTDYFDYLKESRFAFLPQIHDASPRVSTQALALDVPILMNWYIQGGWKYVNSQTGEFFHDMSDFKESLRKILRNADVVKAYEPRKWVLENYGNTHSGKRLLDFVKQHFSHRVQLPRNTKLLLI